MDKKEFCETVSGLVRFASLDEKQDIEQELIDHFEDHIEALTESGWSEEEAETAAVEAMGNPEEIGQALNQQYPLGWLVLSRVSIIGTALLIVLAFFTFPLISNVYHNIVARTNPTWDFTQTDEYPDGMVKPLDITVELGQNRVHFYESVTYYEEEDGYMASVSACAYAKNPLRSAPQSCWEKIQVINTGTGWPGDGGGWFCAGASYRHYHYQVSYGQASLHFTYDYCGTAFDCEIPLDWNQMEERGAA